MAHQIKFEDLQLWLQDEQLILFASTTENGGKRLYATLRGSYEVHHKGKMVWQGIQPYRAVEEYNKV